LVLVGNIPVAVKFMLDAGSQNGQRYSFVSGTEDQMHNLVDPFTSYRLIAYLRNYVALSKSLLVRRRTGKY